MKQSLYPQENGEMKLMHMKSLEDLSLIENVVLPTYKGRWEKRRRQMKAEESILSKRKMTLALERGYIVRMELNENKIHLNIPKN